MKRIAQIVVMSIVVLLSWMTMAQQPPLYLVNGERVANIDSIPPEMILSVDMLPADEENIARYGEAAQHGVIVVTLKYDRAARFLNDSLTFDRYIARKTVWAKNEPAARVVLRYTVGVDGTVRIKEFLEATDKRFRRRVMKAVEEAPRWQPATQRGVAVEYEGVLRVELPEGKRIPRPVELIIR